MINPKIEKSTIKAHLVFLADAFLDCTSFHPAFGRDKPFLWADLVGTFLVYPKAS